MWRKYEQEWVLLIFGFAAGMFGLFWGWVIWGR